MFLPRVSIQRPVFATVISLLLVVLGIGSLLQLPVREFPDVDPPTVSVTTVYPGASAAVVEREVTEVIEEAVSSIEGIDLVTSTSREQFSRIDIEFLLSRDLDAAAADVRDKLGEVRSELPEQAEEPVISKASGDAQAMMWLTLVSPERDRLELTDFADRNLVDPLSIVPGVSTARRRPTSGSTSGRSARRCSSCSASSTSPTTARAARPTRSWSGRSLLNARFPRTCSPSTSAPRPPAS